MTMDWRGRPVPQRLARRYEEEMEFIRSLDAEPSVVNRLAMAADWLTLHSQPPPLGVANMAIAQIIRDVVEESQRHLEEEKAQSGVSRAARRRIARRKQA